MTWTTTPQPGAYFWRLKPGAKLILHVKVWLEEDVNGELTRLVYNEPHQNHGFPVNDGRGETGEFLPITAIIDACEHVRLLESRSFAANKRLDDLERRVAAIERQPTACEPNRLLCPWCNHTWESALEPNNYDCCPKCVGSFSFKKPQFVPSAEPKPASGLWALVERLKRVYMTPESAREVNAIVAELEAALRATPRQSWPDCKRCNSPLVGHEEGRDICESCWYEGLDKQPREGSASAPRETPAPR